MPRKRVILTMPRCTTRRMAHAIPGEYCKYCDDMSSASYADGSSAVSRRFLRGSCYFVPKAVMASHIARYADRHFAQKPHRHDFAFFTRYLRRAHAYRLIAGDAWFPARRATDRPFLSLASAREGSRALRRLFLISRFYFISRRSLIDIALLLSISLLHATSPDNTFSPPNADVPPLTTTRVIAKSLEHAAASLQSPAAAALTGSRLSRHTFRAA